MKLHHFQEITASFQTLQAPPPYSHGYQFIIQPQGAQLKVLYQLTYTDRESLTEDEILEEGFTLDDDYGWEGILPEVWQQALVKMLQQTTKIDPKPTNIYPNVIRLKVQISEEETVEGTPDNLEGWEYFLQELTQAVFELSLKERPLEVYYLENLASDQSLSIAIKPSFSTRRLDVEVSHNKKKQSKELSWDQLKPLLKAIYLPDYDEEQARVQQPKKPGQYIDPGEGKWYELYKGITNPGKQYDAVGALEKEIKKLI